MNSTRRLRIGMAIDMSPSDLKQRHDEEPKIESQSSKKNQDKTRQGLRAVGRTIGPVSDLERHLPRDWWKNLFNSLYLKTDGDVVENDENTERDVKMLIRVAALEKNDRILDLCCGQGRHSLELARQGFPNITGIDRSRYLVRLARKRANNLGLDVRFREGDARRIRGVNLPFHSVAVLGNSFGYFDHEDDDLAVLLAIKRVLVSKGTIIIDLLDGEWMRNNFESRSWEWIDQSHFVCRERSLTADRERLVSREVVVHAERGVIADQFYAERLYVRDTLAELLERAKFGSIRFHDSPVTDSKRNQDLGMMAARMTVTAQAPRKSAPTGGPKRQVSKLVVMMGDPTLPDAVKRGGQFNEEDLDTVRRLKDALAELTEFDIRYLHQHSLFVSELRDDPPRLVMNLCDEGWNNDAFMELHVPALLEILDIPFTGAGPACLGMCYDKGIVRAIAESLDIPAPLETFYNPSDQSANLPSIFPALIKPNFGDSSIGITKEAVVHNTIELLNYFERLTSEWPGRPILIQEFLDGPEYTVGIIGNPGSKFHAFPILEVDFSGLPNDLPKILGYESKWLPDSPYWNQIRYIPAKLEEDTGRRLVDNSMALFERLQCRDYARFDFRADSQGEIKLLEVNPNPGWCWDGKMNLMAEMEGLRYSDLLRMILEAASDRIQSPAP